MKAANSICRHCHRLRPTSGGYCGNCASDLRAQERRRPVVDAAVAAVLTPSLAPAEAATPEIALHEVVSTLPPPPEPPPVVAAPPAALPSPPALPGDPPALPAFVLPTIGEEEAPYGF
jgi:hypothetical protein